MKKVISVLIVLIVLAPSISCNKNILDKRPLDQYDEGAVWKDLGLMESFVNFIYIGLPQEATQRMMMTSLTDESMFNSGAGQPEATLSLTTPSDYTIFDRFLVQQALRWENVYKQVRACNLFLEQVEKNTYDNTAKKDRLTGEVLFLRAYYYNILAFMYGGVPIITKPYSLKDDFQVPRNTFEECIKFIVDDCDKAATLLPLAHESNNYGRATRGAALALKARVLLYAASDLYNSNGAWMGGYSNPELVGYVGGDRIARWKAAKDAAKAVIDLGVYQLYKSNPAPADNIAKNYAEIFLSMQTSEDVFVRVFDLSIVGSQGIEFTNSPGGYGGWGNTNPTNQFVDAFEMNDGTKFSWSNPEQAKHPYSNREPRFYANINFEGAPWRERPANGQALDPKGVIQVGFYQKADGSWVSGLDTRSSPVAAFAGTYTGYFMRKFIDPAVVIPYQKQSFPWRYLRYAEVLLGYAEACAELGEEAEAQNYINIIRKRAGLPDVHTTGETLIESVKHERRIELAFESHRYFDIRRWMIAPQVMTDVKAIYIQKFYNQTDTTYSIINDQKRDWKDRSYFMPIRLEEMNKNNKLIQNPLY
ncbi:MAG: RagB/SusD family nutrient uptake outer membrane protein [Chitinophagaceae bacterium]|nr:RagB/SusD family nutrient uptake outer membrane protein [Chitinophagaceae bacterium]